MSKKLEMQFSSKNECLNYLQKALFDWGTKISKYDRNPQYRGNPTPLLVNPSKLFFKGFYISNCISSIIFLLFFIILTVINNSNSSTTSNASVDVDLEDQNNINVIVNYYYELNATKLLNDSTEVINDRNYSISNLIKYDNRINETLNCENVVKSEKKRLGISLRYLFNTAYRVLQETTNSDTEANSESVSTTDITNSTATNSSSNNTSTSELLIICENINDCKLIFIFYYLL